MKIQSTPTHLIIDSQPWILAGILGVMGFVALAWAALALLHGNLTEMLVALVAAGFGFLFAWAFIRRNQLILDATTGTMIWRERGLMRYQQIKFDLAHLAGARLETNRSSDTATYRVLLDVAGGMNAGQHPLTKVYSSGKGHERAADAINQWLRERPCR